MPWSQFLTRWTFIVALILVVLISLNTQPNVSAASTTLVISQVYGGGGNSGATLTNDYIELFNLGTTPISLDGYSVQYASSSGNFTQKTDLTNITLNPGQYYLVQQAEGSGGTTPLPAPDTAGTINMSGSSGKVALVNSTTLLSCGGSTACSDTQLATIVDLIGYGSANFFEGAATVGLSNTTAALRTGNGCSDTDNNSADYSVTTPAPRNTSSPTNTCDGTPVTPTPPSGDTTPIYTIQGSTTGLTSLESPLVGESVTTEGVVSAVLGNGFFVQDVAGDGDPTTSDGLFVFTDSMPTISSGDLVSVTGTVTEFRGSRSNDLTLTQLADPGLDITVTGSAALPTPVVIDAPNESINPDGIVYWERLEGMHTTLDDPTVVGSTFARFGEIWVVGAQDAQPGSGFQSSGNLILRDLPGDAVDYNPERIVIDDETRVGGGDDTRIVTAGNESAQVRVTVGDTFASISGVLDYRFGLYRMQPLSDPEASLTSRQGPPTLGFSGIRATAADEVSVVSFNFENFFDAVDDPNKNDSPILTATEIERKAAKLTLAIADELKCPDIIVIAEIEEALVLNGDDNGNVRGTDVQALVPRLAGRGCPYLAVSRDATDDRSIEAAFMYRTDRGIDLDSFYLATEGDTDTPAKADTNNAFNGLGEFGDSREPLVGEFRVDGAPVIVIGNHWNSKGGDDALYGNVQPPVRDTEEQRKLQAQYVRDYLDEVVFAVNPGAAVVVAGDLNDFAFPEPGEGNDPVTILKSSSAAPLTNLIDQLPESEQYTFVFQGNSQVLDHIVVSSSMLSTVQDVTTAQINASFGGLYEDDTTTSASASDHDPVVAWFSRSGLVQTATE
ncbi:MAG: lamin tail domain-containing protein [Chloroflexota bacterium]